MPISSNAVSPRQAELEALMRGRGVDRFRRRLGEAVAKGREADTKAGLHLLRARVRDLEARFVDLLTDVRNGKPGRAHKAVALLAGTDAGVLALITSKVIINALSRTTPLTQLARDLGRALEAEARFTRFELKVPHLYKSINDDLDKRTLNPAHRERVLRAAMKRVGVEWEDWLPTERIQVGIKAVDLFLATFPGFELVTVRDRPRQPPRHFIRATEEAVAWVEKFNVANEALSPDFLPAVVPPKPWTGVWGGGYWTDNVPRLPLVKGRHGAYLTELSQVEMPTVYAALNAVQATAWRINTAVLRVAEALWETTGGGVAGLPQREPLPLPPKPHNIATDLDARKSWKRHAAKVYTANATSLSRRMAVVRCLQTARQFAAEPAIYFPHQLDFRGRFYAVPQYLSPQGDDLAKGLLLFAAGKPVRGERAIGWLMIHLANSFGADKLPLAERVQWAEAHDHEIRAAAADPLANRWWLTAESPFQFLAACLDWAAFRADPEGHVSCLPVSLDGSCNGLQHFSALLRDPVGGAAVNLVPGARPEDIYQRVADRAIALLREQDTPEARGWLAFGLDRKVAKRPVMVLPYGGTFSSCLAYVEQAVRERGGWQGVLAADEDALSAAVLTGARAIWSAIGDVVVAARRAMSWLQTIARSAAKGGAPLVWSTPSGFVVHQFYPEVKERQIKAKLLGKLIQPRVRDELPRVDAYRQALASAPNFVHSLDAAALALTVELAAENGLTNFAMIHDSYGTLAADVDMLSACLREAFVDMYEQHDPLVDLRSATAEVVAEEDLPPPPPRGDLDLAAVRDSAYFFA